MSTYARSHAGADGPRPHGWIRLLIIGAVGLILLSITYAAAASIGVDPGDVGNPNQTASLEECTLPALQDSWVRNNAPDDNYGTQARAFTRPQNNGGNNVRRAYVLVSVGTSASPIGICEETSTTIPSGATIKNAELRLWMFNDPTDPRTVTAQTVSSAPSAQWNQNTITWNNQPPIVTGTAFPTTLPVGNGVAVAWDVTGSVRDIWAGTANNGWRIADANETSGGNGNNTYLARFRSSEYGTASERPKLLVAYEP